MRLVDSHCHLQAEAFAADRDAVIAAARAAGVERLLVPGWDLESSRAALELTDADSGLDAAAGIHPHAAATSSPDDWRTIQALARDPRIVAIGETGLDYDRLFSPVESQLTNLRRHLALAQEVGKPAILHCRSANGRRDAQDALLAELEGAGFLGPAARAAFGGRPPAVLHSFSGPVDYAEQALAMGLAISISGLAFRRGEEPTEEVVRLVPAGRLLVETDSPYLSPPGAPRRRNAPEWVRLTSDWVARVRGMPGVELGDDLVAAYDATFAPIDLTER